MRQSPGPLVKTTATRRAETRCYSPSRLLAQGGASQIPLHKGYTSREPDDDGPSTRRGQLGSGPKSAAFRIEVAAQIPLNARAVRRQLADPRPPGRHP
jgi:hypothetical protein